MFLYCFVYIVTRMCGAVAAKPQDERQSLLAKADFSIARLQDDFRGLSSSQGSLFALPYAPSQTINGMRLECEAALDKWNKFTQEYAKLQGRQPNTVEYELLKRLFAEALASTHNFGTRLEALKSFYSSYASSLVKINDGIKRLHAERRWVLETLHPNDQKAKLEEIDGSIKMLEGAARDLKFYAEMNYKNFFSSSSPNGASEDFVKAFGMAKTFSDFDAKQFVGMLMLDVRMPSFKSIGEAKAFLEAFKARLEDEERQQINFSVLRMEGSHVLKNPDDSLQTELLLPQKTRDALRADYYKVSRELIEAHYALMQKDDPQSFNNAMAHLKKTQSLLSEARSEAAEQIGRYYHDKFFPTDYAMPIYRGAVVAGGILATILTTPAGGAAVFSLGFGASGALNCYVGYNIPGNEALVKQGWFEVGMAVFAAAAGPISAGATRLAQAGYAGTSTTLNLTMAGAGLYFTGSMVGEITRIAVNGAKYGMVTEDWLALAEQTFMLVGIGVGAASAKRAAGRAKPGRAAPKEQFARDAGKVLEEPPTAAEPKIEPQVRAPAAVEATSAQARAAEAPSRIIPEARVAELTQRYSSLTEPQTAFDRLMVKAIDERMDVRSISREAAAAEVLAEASVNAEYVAIKSKSGRPSGNFYEAFAYDMAVKAAREAGRAAPLAEDFLAGALLETHVKGFAYMHPEYAEAFLRNVNRLSERFSLADLQTVLSEYMNSTREVLLRLPKGLQKDGSIHPNEVRDVGLVLDFAAELHLKGVTDPLSFLTNAEGKGLLDLFPVHNLDSLAALSNAAEHLAKRVAARIPAEKAAFVEPTLRWVLDDLARLPEDMREDYALKFSNAFKLEGKVAARLEKPMGKTHLPLYTYLLDERSGGRLLKALDNDGFRSELRDANTFESFVTFLEHIGGSFSQIETGSIAAKAWLDAAMGSLDYLMDTGTAEAAKPKRQAFARQKVSRFNQLWDFYQEGKLKPEDVVSLSESLVGRQSLQEFLSTIDAKYAEVFAAQLQIPVELATSNLELLVNYADYRKNLSRVAGFDWTAEQHGFFGRRQALTQAIGLLDDAMKAHLEGRFAEFKYTEAFRRELVALLGEERGSTLFSQWKTDFAFEMSVGAEPLRVTETGAFDDSFYGGAVKGVATCQDPRNAHFVSAAIVGTAELPWSKQVLVRAPGSPEILLRRRLNMVHGEEGQPILLVQPSYHAEGMVGAAELDAAIVSSLRAKYEPLGVEVRVISGMMNYDGGVNTGYSTFASGRAPFFYFDSNAQTGLVRGSWGEGRVNHGFYDRGADGVVSFPRGWSGKF